MCISAVLIQAISVYFGQVVYACVCISARSLCV